MSRIADPRPATPASPSPAPLPGPPEPQRSPLTFLVLMFVVPLIVVLAIAKLGIPERLAEWIGKLFG